MRICYLIFTHRGEEQILRLVKTIKRSDPSSFILISHDFGVSSLHRDKFECMDGVRVIAEKGSRSTFQIIQKYCTSIDWLMKNEIDFDWLISLSGQDYPVQPLAHVAEMLENTEYDGFMEYFKVFSEESPWGVREGRSRYCFRYWQITEKIPSSLQRLLMPLHIINFLQPFFRVNFAYGAALAIRTKTPFSGSVNCYGGSFFCTLSRKCIQYIYDHWKSETSLIQFYKGVNMSSESLLQTLLLNNPRFKIFNDCFVFADFSQTRNGHPRLLTSEDYSELARHPAHFARKFDLSLDEQVLNLLDNLIFEEVKPQA